MTNAITSDPVCGMSIDITKARFSSEYNGQTFYFCSPGWKGAFDASPQQYVSQITSAPGSDAHRDHSRATACF